MAGKFGNILNAKALTSSVNLPVGPLLAAGGAAALATVVPGVEQALKPAAEFLGTGSQVFAAGVGASLYAMKDSVREAGSGMMAAVGAKAGQNAVEEAASRTLEEVDRDKVIEGEGLVKDDSHGLGDQGKPVVAPIIDNENPNMMAIQHQNSIREVDSEGQPARSSGGGKINAAEAATVAVAGSLAAEAAKDSARTTAEVASAEVGTKKLGADLTGKDEARVEVEQGLNQSAAQAEQLAVQEAQQPDVSMKAGEMLVADNASTQNELAQKATNQEVAGTNLNQGLDPATDPVTADSAGQGHTTMARIEEASKTMQDLQKGGMEVAQADGSPATQLTGQAGPPAPDGPAMNA